VLLRRADGPKPRSDCGVYRFKQGFGGEFTPWIGAWDFPTNRVAHWGYTVAMPKLLDVMRRRHRQKLADSLRSSPMVGVDLDLGRDKRGPRPDIEL
jgi:hypothetical protein